MVRLDVLVPVPLNTSLLHVHEATGHIHGGLALETCADAISHNVRCPPYLPVRNDLALIVVRVVEGKSSTGFSRVQSACWACFIFRALNGVMIRSFFLQKPRLRVVLRDAEKPRLVRLRLLGAVGVGSGAGGCPEEINTSWSAWVMRCCTGVEADNAAGRPDVLRPRLRGDLQGFIRMSSSEMKEVPQVRCVCSDAGKMTCLIIAEEASLARQAARS